MFLYVWWSDDSDSDFVQVALYWYSFLSLWKIIYELVAQVTIFCTPLYLYHTAAQAVNVSLGIKQALLWFNAADAEQMQMKPLQYCFLQISLFSHLTFLGQVYRVEIMSAWVGMRYITSINVVLCLFYIHILGDHTLLKFSTIYF